MFNRRITQRVPPVVQQKNDVASLTGIRTKNLEQRILMSHETGIKALTAKLVDLEGKITEGPKAQVDVKSDPEILKLKEQCAIQSKLLTQYEEKVVNLVEYIKRLEQGLETVKELLTNKTNTVDTIADVPEFDEPTTEETSEEKVKEDLTVESVKEEIEETNDTVSLEIVDEKTV